MGRNTDIYILDKEKATTFLYPALKSGVLYKSTFQEYLTERKLQYPSLSRNSITQILKMVENDINYISADDLSEIINYIDNESYEKFNKKFGEQESYPFKLFDAEIERLYDLYGIKLLYSVHTSTVCYSYMFQFGNYRDHFLVEGIREEYGYNLNSVDYLHFNDYILLMTHRIRTCNLFDMDYAEFTEKELKIIAEVTSFFKENKRMFEAIEEELVWLKKAWDAPEDSYKPEKNTIWWAELFFSKAIEIKETIKPYHSRVLILDSF